MIPIRELMKILHMAEQHVARAPDDGSNRYVGNRLRGLRNSMKNEATVTFFVYDTPSGGFRYANFQEYTEARKAGLRTSWRIEGEDPPYFEQEN